MTITKDIAGISVGIDFVDAVAGKYIVRGNIWVGNANYPFKSTVDQSKTEAALAKAVTNEGRTIKSIEYHAHT